MLEHLNNFFYPGPFMPHGHCYLWQPGLVWLHILSDSLIAISYYSIPITLLYFVRKREDLPFKWIFLLFGAFIVACGSTHIMEVWTLWHSNYWMSGFLKAFTAVVSVLTATLLIPLIPKALALPSPAQLEAANRELQEEIVAYNLAQQALRESEERFRILSACSPIGIYVTDTQGRCTYANPQYYSIGGLTLEEGLGDGWLRVIHPEDRDTVMAGCTTSTGERHPYSGEYRYQTPQGILRWVHTQSSPMISDEGKLLGYVGTVEDITERVITEKELAAKAAELERSNAELEKFAYVASHDLQEPLRMVSSYTQLLARRYQGKLDSSADEFISYAVDGVKRMQILINDLLAYSQVGTSRQAFELIDCEKVFQQALKNLQLAVEDHNAVITHSSLPSLSAVSSQILQLFQNLIGNAIKFHGNEPPRIEVSAEAKTNEWLFSVRDNGIGIAPEYAERIFIIFQRLHTRDDYPGTGIGLAICKKIVERHGGKIWVEANIEQGSIFYFTLPMIQNNDGELQYND